MKIWESCALDSTKAWIPKIKSLRKTCEQWEQCQNDDEVECIYLNDLPFQFPDMDQLSHRLSRKWRRRSHSGWAWRTRVRTHPRTFFCSYPKFKDRTTGTRRRTKSSQECWKLQARNLMRPFYKYYLILLSIYQELIKLTSVWRSLEKHYFITIFNKNSF